MASIYLDYNASTPIDLAVVEAMRPFLDEAYGNPSSGHWASAPAKTTLEQARDQVAALLGCATDEVVFTSGGSEANNLALKGVFFARGDRPSHIITTEIEHPAILAPCRFLERLGATVTYVPVDGSGRVDPDAIRKAITKDTCLISVMHANNEVGTIQPIAEIARIARANTAFFSIPMPRNRSARYRRRSTSSASICFPLRATSLRPEGDRRPLCARRRCNRALDPRRRPRERTARRHGKRLVDRSARQSLRDCASLDRHDRRCNACATCSGTVFAAIVWQSGRPQWSSGRAASEYAQRLVRRP